MSFQDWVPITITNPDKQKVVKKIIEKKGDLSIQQNLAKIDNETENFNIKKIPIALSKEISAARIIKKLTQKELANKLNIIPSIYIDIENGKAIYNIETKKHINNIQKILNVKFINK
jgi:ribosome-binding protein aMBF1 (putative translation factor)